MRRRFAPLFSVVLWACGASAPAPAAPPGPAAAEPPAASGGGEVYLGAAPGAEPTAEGPTAAELIASADPGALDDALSGEGVGLAATDEHACTTDAECALTPFAGCCSESLCPGEERAVNRAWLDRQLAPCARVECSGRMVADRRCPPAAPRTPACVSGVCTAR